MTSAVDWALNNNYLSIFTIEKRPYQKSVKVRRSLAWRDYGLLSAGGAIYHMQVCLYIPYCVHSTQWLGQCFNAFVVGDAANESLVMRGPKANIHSRGSNPQRRVIVPYRSSEPLNLLRPDLVVLWRHPISGQWHVNCRVSRGILVVKIIARVESMVDVCASSIFWTTQPVMLMGKEFVIEHHVRRFGVALFKAKVTAKVQICNECLYVRYIPNCVAFCD